MSTVAARIIPKSNSAPKPRATVALCASPLVWLAAAFALGILIENVVRSGVSETRLHEVDALIGVCCTIAFVMSACGVWCFACARWRGATLCLLLAFICTGTCFARAERAGVAANSVRKFYDEGRIAPGAPVEVTGVMVGAAEPMPDGFAVRLRIEELRHGETEETASGQVRLFAQVASRAALARYQQLELRHGARLRVTCVLRRAEAFLNPGVTSQIELLDRAGLDASGAIKSPLLIERLDDEPVFLPLWWLYRWRAEALARVHNTFEPHTAGLLGAMLLGNDFFITRDVGERFRIGGTYHVLVISGMHITIIGFVVLLIVGRFTLHPLARFIATTFAVWGYAFAVGAGTSVVRAALMFTLLVLAPVLARPANALNALGGAALLLLAWQPGDLFNPSFQLTFLSVLSITAVALPVLAKLRAVGVWRPTAATPYPPRCPAWWRKLGELLFWDEHRWQEEMRHSLLTYKLRKSRAALWLQRYRLQVPLRYTITCLVVSACVQIVMLPLLVIHFHRVSLIALLLNLVVGIMMTCVTIGALLALMLGEVSGSIAALFVLCTQWLNSFMVHSVDPFMASRAASFRVPAYSGAGKVLYALYYLPLAILLGVLWNWRPVSRALTLRGATKRRRWKEFTACLMFVALTTLILAHPRSSEVKDARLRIDFLDVGQGDAALITLPDNTTLLVDGGGKRALVKNKNPGVKAEREVGSDEEITADYDRRTIGDAVVSEYLWWRGLDRVDYILATHADTDHMEGLNAVARNFDVRAAFIGRATAAQVRDPDFVELMNTLGERQIPAHTIAAGDVLRIGDAKLDVLHPFAYGAGRNNNTNSSNNNSVVISLSYGKRRFLLTGDIERAAETALLRNEQELLAADVVKVAHHGSRTSSIEEFVRASHPSLAVISVGRESPFGHPHADVIKRWQASGARVLTTGERGTITISTDGEDLRIETFIDEKAQASESNSLAP